MLEFKPNDGHGCCHCSRCSAVEVEGFLGSDGNYYCNNCVDEMVALGEAEWYKSTAHSKTNRLWQVNYEVYRLEHFRAMLVEDSRLPLFSPTTRDYLSFLLVNPDASRSDVARHLRRSVLTLRDLLPVAVEYYRHRLQEPTFQPKGYKRKHGGSV